MKRILNASVISLYLVVCHNAFAQNAIRFPMACEPGVQVTIAFVGDILLHLPLQKQALKSGYESLWNNTIPVIHKADLAYANLEGPVAEGLTRSGKYLPGNTSNQVYTGYPLFNYPPTLLRDLKKSGFDIVSTANNHALDRSAIGIDKTLAALEKNHIQYTGTKKRKENHSFETITQVKGMKIAWISCTEHTNGISDSKQQVLYCFKKDHKNWIKNKILQLKKNVDAIIVLPHWGEEYQSNPSKAQKQLARDFLNWGADAVIGAHPHVLQPIEFYKTKDNRATLISYSLGNFVSFQGSPQRRATIVLLLGLTKNAKHTFINGFRAIPFYMQNRHHPNLTLIPISASNKNVLPFMKKLIPSGNLQFTPNLTTNSECFR